MYFCSFCERELIGWRHKTHRWCKIQRTLGLRTKQWRTSFYGFWRVISRQKKLRWTRFIVIYLSLDLYFTFLRKTVGKKIWKFRRSSTLSPGQTIATCQRNISQYCWAQYAAHVWSSCWAVLRHVRVSLAQIWLSLTLSQQHPTCRNSPQHVAKHAQNVAPTNVALWQMNIWKNIYLNMRIYDWKNFQAWEGFAPMTCAIPVQCSTNWAIKPSGSWSHCEFKVGILALFIWEFLPQFTLERYQDPDLWAWFEYFSRLRGTNSKTTHKLTLCVFF